MAKMNKKLTLQIIFYDYEYGEYGNDFEIGDHDQASNNLNSIVPSRLEPSYSY